MTDLTIEEPQEERPTSLKVASILSWIAESFFILVLGVIMLFEDFFITNKDEFIDKDTTGNMELFFYQLENQYSLVLGYPFLLNIVSFIGVVYMFKLKKIGFHLYTISHLILIVLAYILSEEMGWTGLIISLSFIGIYASNLKFMK